MSKVAIDDVVVERRMRPLDIGKVKELASSLRDLGLINPITITEELRLVAGYHRLEAARLLGWREIDAHTVSLDVLRTELAEIDENLVRNELGVIERGEHFKRRKEIYEALYPQTKHGGAPANKGGQGGKQPKGKDEIVSSLPSFAADTAAKTGLTERVIQQDVQIATDLAPDVKEKLRGTEAGNNKNLLLHLARKPPEEQRALVEDLASVSGKGLARATREAKRKEAREDIAAKGSRSRGDVVIPRKKYNALLVLSRETRTLAHERLELIRIATLRQKAEELHSAIEALNTNQEN